MYGNAKLFWHLDWWKVDGVLIWPLKPHDQRLWKELTWPINVELVRFTFIESLMVRKLRWLFHLSFHLMCCQKRLLLRPILIKLDLLIITRLRRNMLRKLNYHQSSYIVSPDLTALLKLWGWFSFCFPPSIVIFVLNHNGNHFFCTLVCSSKFTDLTRQREQVMECYCCHGMIHIPNTSSWIHALPASPPTANNVLVNSLAFMSYLTIEGSHDVV